MLIVIDLLAAFLIALLIVGLFMAAFGASRAPWASLPLFFLVVFLAAWAGGVWVTPFGPPIGGVYWLPFVMVGLLVAVLLAAAATPPRLWESPARASGRESGAETEPASAVAVELLVWVAVALLVVYIGSHYLATQV